MAKTIPTEKKNQGLAEVQPRPEMWRLDGQAPHNPHDFVKSSRFHLPLLKIDRFIIEQDCRQICLLASVRLRSFRGNSRIAPVSSH